MPTSNVLEVGQCMQVTVLFQPKAVGDFTGELCINYDTGKRGHDVSKGISYMYMYDAGMHRIHTCTLYISLSSKSLCDTQMFLSSVHYFPS